MRKLRISSMGILLLFLMHTAAAQSKLLKGKVSDAIDGTPIAGATITGKGSNLATVTNADGTFELDVPSSVSTLVISFIGFTTIELPVTADLSDIRLSENQSSLSEVVVVGFGTKIKKDLTGNIARVKGDEVSYTPVANFNQALQGRAAGVFVESNSGRVGEGVKVRVRGSGSISASNSPLYVIDGIPISESANSGSSLPDINFNDVESFEILKDASAAAIYGSRAANGVVLITTRQGKAGATRVNVNAQYGFNKPTNNREFLNAQQYIELFREAAINSDNIDGIDPLDPAEYEDSWLEYVEDRFTRYSGWSDWRKLETNTNWERLAYNDNSRTKIMDVNVAGGNDKTRFYISGSVSDQDGILINNFFQRISGRVNVDHEVSKKVNIGVNFGLTRTRTNRITLDNGFQNPLQMIALAPITPPRDQDGNLYNTPVTTYYNGLLEVDNVKRSSVNFRNLGNVYLNYRIINNLVFKSELGLDIQNQTDNYYGGPLSLTGASINGFGSADWYKSVNYNTNNYFNYTKQFGTLHDLDLTAGMSFQQYESERAWVEGQDFPVNELNRLASAGEITGGSSTGTQRAFLSYFARAGYKFADKYLLNLSGRIDGSSAFGVDRRYGFFPAVSAGWILSNENFLTGSKALSFLKLRASWGLTGNADGFGDFAHLGLWGGTKYNGTSGLIPTQLPNPALRWEKSDQYDIGLDFGFFNNRITGELDYYSRLTRDLIYNVPIPGTSGFTTQTVNIGSMSNKGVELVINANIITGKDFNWTTGLNVSYNRNKIEKLDGEQDKIPGNDGRYLNSLIVGESIGVFYGPKYAGVDPDNGDALWYQEDGKTTTNNYNQAGDFVVGNPNPDYIAGFNNTIRFKGFDLAVLFQGVFGNQIQNGAGGFMSTGADWFDNQTIDQLRRWQKPGDITDVPQARFYYSNGTGASSRYTYDGSYIRLKTLTFGYSLPGSITNRLKMSSVRAYIAGVNLLTFTKYPGWDPEVNSDYRAGNRNQGGDFYSAPQIKSVTFGLTIGF